ncbi:MMPL family transporter [Streptomyces sp. UNOC14_S4]|uniref:MMPL family transporter n=1 Tax=Streptomyces sp. UNOC14_S4 TaxID=2872340 RepID=UPI001E62C675|nr:MMPL family transporter [Streptomyces sp. UNOC14_S4]MCC3766756.1 MMPL family transporter [Streptomyces sp. UNOC14_S4]
MFQRLAQAVLQRGRRLLYASLLLFVVAAAVGATVLPKLSAGGYSDTGTESARAARFLEERFHAGQPNLVLLVKDDRGIDDKGTAAAAAKVTERLSKEPDVTEAYSYWSTGRPEALRATDAKSALIMAWVKGDEDHVQKWMTDHADDYQGTVEGLDISQGGTAKASEEIIGQTMKDLVKAEAIAMPILLVVLIFVFRGVVAAAMPLVIGTLTMACAFFVLRILSVFTDVSVFAMNITTGLGLGLAVDYSLFIISRYREELARGADTDEALIASMRTAGRTVAFSAVTVALALSGLLVFPFYFLRSFAYAGIPVALIAALASVTVLPALLKVLGPRINSLQILKRRKPAAEKNFWQRTAMVVMRFPLPVGLAAVALLLLLGAPFLKMKMSLADERVLPTSAGSFQVGKALREGYSSQENGSELVVMREVGDPAQAAGKIGAYARQLSGLEGVSRVDTYTGSYVQGKQAAPAGPASAAFAAEQSAYLKVVPKEPETDDAGRELVREIRDADAPFPVQVTGPGAILEDSLDSLTSKMPWALGIVGGSTLVLLFLLTGSVLLPLKALVLNMLSLSTTFGVLVWGFQEGHLNGVIGSFTVTGAITWSVPMLLFCVAFGLSMDYEVFLLSRIKEEYEQTGDNVASVARGLGRTGSLVSAAAVLIAIVFAGFMTSSITYLKAIGLGLALAVIMDATVVRGLLVPAFMRLAGRANWWAPGPLRLLHRKIGLREGDGPAPLSRQQDDSDSVASGTGRS